TFHHGSSTRSTMFKHRPDKEGIKTRRRGFLKRIQEFKHRPDKEGIKTLVPRGLAGIASGSNTDLIKKGLRPVAITIFKS
ncbi:MAG TPA: hypothetical protein PKO17_03755, partial [Pseudomonadales bacterium]|nr:hypothetical protein [Pseudomonadales bacterium]